MEEKFQLDNLLQDFVPNSNNLEPLNKFEEIQESLNKYNFNKNEDIYIDLLGIIGISIFSLLYFKLKSRNSLIQRLISISWIIIGYKFYLEQSVSDILFNKFNIFNGLMNISIGLMLFFNFLEFSKIKEHLTKKSFLNNIKLIFNFLFLNFSNGIFDIDKVMPFHNNLPVFRTILNYVFVGLNTFPLLSNMFINKNIFNIPIILYPSPYALATLTIFLNNFRTFYPYPSKLFIIIDLVCYGFIIINLVNDIFLLRIFSYQHFFYLALNVLNFIFIFYFDIFGLSSSGQENLTILDVKNEDNLSYNYAGISIKNNPDGNGGIQGFFQREFFIDQFGVVANSFLVFSSRSLSLIQDLAVRPVKVEANLIKYIYPRLYC